MVGSEMTSVNIITTLICNDDTEAYAVYFCSGAGRWRGDDEFESEGGGEAGRSERNRRKGKSMEKSKQGE